MSHIHFHKERCVGCRYCELYCSLEKEQACWPAASRIRIHREEPTGEEQGQVCQQCLQALCVRSCPEEALIMNPVTKVVDYDQQRCSLCLICVEVCPFKAVWLSPQKDKIVKCDLCQKSRPACVAGCPEKALEVIT